MIKLPRLPIGWRTQPQLFERYWSEAMTKIETVVNEVLKIPIIEAALDDKEDSGTAATTIAEHEAAADPHPQYLTQTEADALYDPLGSGGSTTVGGGFLVDDGSSAAAGVFLLNDGDSL